MKLYVLIRNDLSRSQKTVQGIHATAQVLLYKNSWKDFWGNGHVVCLKVQNEEELKDYILKAKELNLCYDFFKEPDINNAITSVAIFSEKDDLFKDLTLL